MLSAGTTLGGRYRLDERIAGGGMGDVWRGTDEVLGRTVAIKVLLPALLEEPGFAERFRGEARTMATINHPGVVDIYDYGSENGTAFLIMEYVEGDALSRTLSRVGRLTPARAMALVAQAADALHAAHEKGIVHRDVKPGNLLVRPNGTLVLTDFGIARSAAIAQLTAAGSVLGTASYISPEQASGAQATPLSDVYALGVVAYQCLSGQRPFEGDNPLQIAMRHVRDMPPPLPADIPPAIVQLVERAMAKDPAARWPSAAALAQAARRVSGGGTSASPGIPMAAPLGPPGSPVGMPGSPVAYSPVSGPPVSGGPMSGIPMSGSPVSGGAPTSPGAGGTRIMPGGAVPPPPGAAAGGHAARGAAGVPPPPSNETAYFPGDAGGYQPTGGYQSPPNKRQGNNRGLLVGVGAAAAVLVLLLGIGGIWYAMSDNDEKDNPTGQGTTAPATQAPASTKPTGKLVKVPCGDEWTKGAPKLRTPVAQQLKKAKLNVKQVARDDKKGIPGIVLDVQPCGDVPEGTDVTLFYQAGAGQPTAEPTDDASAPPSPATGGGSSPPAGGAKPSCTPPAILVGNQCVG
ncbi:serine/threonine-protein kinase [Dactylosporangium sp. NPDC049525]|uniref:serine/threonine-protein kinase n=1 Tax=Dactylosporangium sp. NPDC049525 TaxID=3154730 RepID=UPI0034472E3A